MVESSGQLERGTTVHNYKWITVRMYGVCIIGLAAITTWTRYKM